MNQDIETIESIYDEINDILDGAINELRKVKNKDLRNEAVSEVREMARINKNLLDISDNFKDEKSSEEYESENESEEYDD
jgi:hypothetical protein